MVNKPDVLFGAVVATVASAMVLSYLKSEAVSGRAPAPPFEISDIDGRGNSGLVVPSRDGKYNNVFVKTNKTESIWTPYRDVAGDLARGYRDKVEEKIFNLTNRNISLGTLR